MPIPKSLMILGLKCTIFLRRRCQKHLWSKKNNNLLSLFICRNCRGTKQKKAKTIRNSKWIDWIPKRQRGAHKMASAFKSRLKMRRDSKLLLLLKPKILLQTALILSCFTTCLCQSKIQEILVDGDLNNFSPNLVRHPRDISQGSHDVSSLAYPTK